MNGALATTDQAAVALIGEAERALAEVSTPQDADELLRKVRAVEEAARLAHAADEKLAAIIRIRLRARRRWGELLGRPAAGANQHSAPGVTSSHSSASASRKTIERARRLAGIPEPLFAAFLGHDEPDRLSEAALVRLAHDLERLDSKQARANALQDAIGRAEAEGRPIGAGDVRAAVESQLPTPSPGPEESPAAPAGEQPQSPIESCESPSAEKGPPQSPAEKVEALAAGCRRLPTLVDALDIEAAAEDRPESLQRWHAAFGDACDALAKLTDQLDQESRKQVEATASRAGIELR